MICRTATVVRSRSGPSSVRRSRERRRGAALVEMAIVLPVFMVLMFGIVELGRAFMVGQLVSNASREGARLSILDGQTNTSVSNAVRNFLQQSAGTRPADVNVTITVNSATAGNQVASSQAGDLITVTVAVPFSKVSFFPPMFLGSSSLRATCTMQRE